VEKFIGPRICHSPLREPLLRCFGQRVGNALISLRKKNPVDSELDVPMTHVAAIRPTTSSPCQAGNIDTGIDENDVRGLSF
jgi:hypothetical protein